MIAEPTVPEAAPVQLVLADDSPQARRAVAAIVERTPGFEVVAVAESGEEALDLVGRLRPPLAVLDIRMPGIGGIEAARTIAQRYPETMVVLVTALGADEVPSAVNGSGVAAVIHKCELTADRLAALWKEGGGGNGFRG